METPAALLLDVGGVLVEDQWAVVANRWAALAKASATELHAILRRRAESLDLGEIDLTVYFKEVEADSHRSVPWSWFERQALDESLIPSAANFAALDAIRARGVRAVALTNVGPEIAEALERKMHLSSHFDAMIRSYQLKARKPARSLFQAALKEARVPARECLFIDDSREYVAASQEMGIPSKWIAGPSEFIPALAGAFPGAMLRSGGSSRPIGGG